MNKKWFFPLIIGVLILAGTVGYIELIKKLASPSDEQLESNDPLQKKAQTAEIDDMRNNTDKLIKTGALHKEKRERVRLFSTISTDPKSPVYKRRQHDTQVCSRSRLG